jgi:Holliday junction DNA helicase RuvA
VISQISGKLIDLRDHSAVLEVGSFHYELYVPEFVRRQLQPMLDDTISLRTIEYLEGNPQQGRLTPRMVGFTSDAEREFFDLVCSVDGLGVKKALKAMVRPVRDVAAAIEEQDVEFLSTLPGVGPAMAERIVAKLRRKMAKFALMVARDVPEADATPHDILAEAHAVLQSLGHTSADARRRIEDATAGKKKFKSLEDLLREIYQQQK